eukprot:TRINITY_DN334_c0_g1_i6.p1 TRINITY_DN334_c0_g1~~TRINITY_DN334_c0_g1_i6.p1  ORF type:complete len:127 (-),score=35.60 TRINITY_DN334_c0_g1_i6:113-493(-)
MVDFFFFFFNDTATTEIYTRSIVGSVRCVQETGIILIVTLIFSAEARMIMPRKVQNTPEPELDLSNATPCERSFLAIHSKLSEIAQHLTGNIFALSGDFTELFWLCLLYTSPSPRDLSTSRMPSSA